MIKIKVNFKRLLGLLLLLYLVELSLLIIVDQYELPKWPIYIAAAIVGFWVGWTSVDQVKR